MGLCTSCDSQRLSSVPNSPELEFPPKIHSSWQLSGATVETSKEELGSNTKDSGETCSNVAELQIKGIRKLNPRRRRHFFFFKHKPHVTFVSPEAETLDESYLSRRRSSPISTPSKRLHLHPAPLPTSHNPNSVIQGLVSVSDNKSNGISFIEEQESFNIMGNTIDKSNNTPSVSVLRRDGNFVAASVGRSNSSPFGFHSHSSETKFASSKSSTSVAGSDKYNNNVESPQFIGFSSVSESILTQSPVLSPATVSQLNASREEKKLLRARFFSESTTSPPKNSSVFIPVISDRTMSSTNKFGFTNRPSSGPVLSTRASNVPTKGQRTFQYQLPPPTHVVESLTVPKLYSVSEVVNPLPPSSSSLNQISHPTFSQTKLSKPPKLAFQRKLSFITQNETEKLETADSDNNKEASTTFANGALDKNHHGGFGWISKPSTETQLAKPIPTKPFFLLERGGSGFPAVSTGVVAQRRYFFEPPPPPRNGETQKATIPVPVNKFTFCDVKKIDHLLSAAARKIQSEIDKNGNLNSEFYTHQHNDDTGNITTTVVPSSHDHVQKDKNVSEIVVITEQNVTQSETKSKNECFQSQQQRSDEYEKKEADSISITSRTSSGGCQSIETQRRDFDSGSSRSLIFDCVHGGGNPGSRPRSGRSLSREREPISDSEFLIDDEISDQPELTFNFNKDSSLVLLSRSSSEESLLPYDVTHHLQIGENGTSDRFNSEERDRDATTSDSAFSDVSSKPPDSLPPLQKPTGKSGIGNTTTVGKSKVEKVNSTGYGSRLPQPKTINRPVGSVPVPPTKKNEEKPRLSIKFTPTATIPRPRVSAMSNTTPTVTKQLKTPTTSTSNQKLRNSISMPIKKGIATSVQKIVSQPVTTNTKTPRGRTSSVSSTTSEMKLGPEIITELAQSVAGLRLQLLELQLALEESQQIDIEKDNVIVKLQLEVEELKRMKCPCGGRLDLTLNRMDSKSEKGFGDLVQESSRGTTNTAVQTESPVSTLGSTGVSVVMRSKGGKDPIAPVKLVI